MATDRPLFSKTDVWVLALVFADFAVLVVHPEPITAAVVITVTGTVVILSQLSHGLGQ